MEFSEKHFTFKHFVETSRRIEEGEGATIGSGCKTAGNAFRNADAEDIRGRNAGESASDGGKHASKEG